MKKYYFRPMPLMAEIIRPFPLPRNNEKPRFALDTPQVAPSTVSLQIVYIHILHKHYESFEALCEIYIAFFIY